MNKSQLLDFFNGYEIKVNDTYVLIKDGKCYSMGKVVNITTAQLLQAMEEEAQADYSI